MAQLKNESVKCFALWLLMLLLPQSVFSLLTWEPMWDGTADSTRGAEKFPGWLIKDDSIPSWFLEDSAITVYDAGTPAVGSLWYKRVFTEGTFEISYKIHEGLNGNNNGGIYILGRPGGTQMSDVDEAGTDLMEGTPNIEGMEIEMDSEHIGCLICNNCGFWMQHSPNEYSGIADKNDWINLRISVKGQNFRTWYKQEGAENWITGIDYTHQSPITGRFGMEIYMGHLSFKDIYIAAGCSDPSSERYDREEVENLGWVLDDNGSCDEANWGCKDTAFVDYNPEAQFEDSSQCETLKVSPMNKNSVSQKWSAMNSKLHLEIGEGGLKSIQVFKTSGEQVYGKFDLPAGPYPIELNPGFYFLKFEMEETPSQIHKILIP